MKERIFNLHIFLFLVLYTLIVPCAYAQDNIEIPQPPVEPKPKPTISIKLAAEKAGERVYYTASEWNKLLSQERVGVNKIGLLIGQGNNAFLVSLFDNMGWPGSSNRTDPFQVAKDKTGGQLPTNAQMRIIKNHRESVSNALVTFGGQGISGDYWCSDGSIISMWRDNPYPGSAAHFRIVTADIENGFKEVIVTKGENEEYDFIGPELSSWEKGRGFLRLVGLRGKYGFINGEGEIVVPLIFDGVDGCSPSETSGHNYNWNGEGLMSVCINSQWGFINHKGEIVVPTIYDIVESRCNPAAIIEKEGLQGIINENGNHLLPIEFDEIEGNYYAKDIFFVKKKGKYGFINSNYKEVIPFKYDFVTGFYQYNKENDHGLCGVGIDGKYGYIDKNGIEVIPLTFEFSESFHNNLAGIVLNNKLGFIDTKGVIVIPPQYYVDKVGLGISYGTFANTRQHVVGSFEFSPYIALVKTATNRYIVINNKGKVISEYVYESWLQSGTNGFTLERDGRRVYLDIAGIEYDSEEARASNKIHTWEVLANHGFVDYQYKLGDTFRWKRDYTNAYKWYYKASQNGSVEALMQLGNLFYADDGLEKSYSKAVEWYERFLAKANDNPSVSDFDKSDVYQYMGRIYYWGGWGVESAYSKAFELFKRSSTDQSMYYIGWMYEHGQGTEQDKDKAIEFYQKSNGYGDSEERINKLQSATGGSINGHEWVDLGLSVKWATCNVGASSPSEYGNYYAWGETSTKSEYSWESYKFRTSGDKYDNVKFRKYNTMHKYGRVDKKTRLDYSDDAARVNWGGLWRMPTDAEWTELRTNCMWTWTTQNGKKGYKVSSKTNGNSIFLPAAGNWSDYADSEGFYWSLSLDTGYPYVALCVNFAPDIIGTGYFNRYNGFSVRPVSDITLNQDDY